MDDLKKGYREAEEKARETWRNADGESVSDRLGNAGDEIRKDLGNLGDDARNAGDDARHDGDTADTTDPSAPDAMHRGS